jgi:hypothetical protein
MNGNPILFHRFRKKVPIGSWTFSGRSNNAPLIMMKSGTPIQATEFQMSHVHHLKT